MVSTIPRVIDSQSDSLTVEWDEPRDSRNIVGYVVEYRSGPGASWARADPMTPHSNGQGRFSQIITRLTPNTEYDIRVTSMGSNQRMGDPSPQTVGRTKCAAPRSPPQGIRVSSSGPTEVKITWVRSITTAHLCDQTGVEIWYSDGTQERTQRAGLDQAEYILPSAPHTR